MYPGEKVRKKMENKKKKDRTTLAPAFIEPVYIENPLISNPFLGTILIDSNVKISDILYSRLYRTNFSA